MWVEVVFWIGQALVEFAVELGIGFAADVYRERPLWERLLLLPALLVAILAAAALLFVFAAVVVGVIRAATG